MSTKTVPTVYQSSKTVKRQSKQQKSPLPSHVYLESAEYTKPYTVSSRSCVVPMCQMHRCERAGIYRTAVIIIIMRPYHYETALCITLCTTVCYSLTQKRIGQIFGFGSQISCDNLGSLKMQDIRKCMT